MTDEQWLDRFKLLNVSQICELYEVLGDYSIVMLGGMSPNPSEAENLLEAILVILAGSEA